MTLTATLVAAPRERALEGATLARLRDAWSGGGVRWLSPREAAEFDLPEAPLDLWEAWADLQAEGIDLLVQPAEERPEERPGGRPGGRRKRMLIADMDSTMIRQECIDELAAEAGVGAEVAAITARAMNGEIDFPGALRARVALLRGLPEGVIGKVLAERIAFTPGGRELVATMKAQGARTLLVSGGFTAFAQPIAAALGFDEARANRLLVENGRLTGEVAEPILGREAKVEALTQAAGALGLPVSDVLAVGDGANDLGMLRLAGAGVALHAKPVVAAECSLRVNHGDLSALLFLQGYKRSEFVA